MRNPICKSIIIFISLSLNTHFSFAQKNLPEKQKDSLVEQKYLYHGAYYYPYYSIEWQTKLDSAIHEAPNDAMLYQMKAMPYFKEMKYEAGMQLLDKAVRLDSSYQDYKAFIECIFQKSYRTAINDFELAKHTTKCYGYVMDHNYDFYIGISQLQLNEFDNAIQSLLKSRQEEASAMYGDSSGTYLSSFYLGIGYYETGNYSEALKRLDFAINTYNQFSDAYYYKALCLWETGKVDESYEAIQKCETYFNKKYSINEDNVFYERYPYQINRTYLIQAKNLIEYAYKQKHPIK